MIAFLSLSTLPTTTTTTKKTNTWSRSPLLSKPSPLRFKVSCNAAADDDHKTTETPKLILPKTSLDMQNVDRRNLLLGFGGIYGATNLGSVQSALAYPMTAPDDIQNCFDARIDHPKHSLRGVHCCPTPPKPYKKPRDYMLPVIPKPRIRPAAQRVTPEYIKDYEKAITIMKSLDDDDPLSWIQQAKIHCAYCDDAYIQGNNKDSKYRIQIHSSSLFFPFHRWYLYFYERILGKLIGDPKFALPYWNWDHPTGMMIPSMYEAAMVNKDNPKEKPDPKNNHLFDGYRNVKHLPPVTMDLHHYEEKNIEPALLVDQNLTTMRRQMIDNAQTARCFFGKDPSPPNPNPRTIQLEEKDYDDDEKLAGSIESPVHNVVHNWTGNPRLPMGEDMGDFYSAGYDPIFFAHHANVDRMWTIWKGLNPKQNKDPKSDDWLNASYVFYDENRDLVRVYNKDCVDTIRMGYKYEDSPIPWKDYESTSGISKKKKLDLAANSVRDEKSVEDMKFPVKLDKVVKVYVKRPVKKRSNKDKENVKEMLFLNGIRYDTSVFLKFDVLVNDIDDETEINASHSEFAGSFTAVAHHHGGKMSTSGAVFGITKLIEDLEAEDDEDILVSLVPRTGADDVTISEIKIELVPIDD